MRRAQYACTRSARQASSCVNAASIIGTSKGFARWLVRRHRELKDTEAERNDAIYRRIADEVNARAFAVTPLTARQIRRLIYG